MRIAIGSDHAGFALKEAVKVFLTAEHRDIRLRKPSVKPCATNGPRAAFCSAGAALASRWPFSSRWTRPEHDVQMMAVRLSEVYI
jgi:hypothetical protein